jgi:peptide/nickel transport system substrate-binding protein
VSSGSPRTAGAATSPKHGGDLVFARAADIFSLNPVKVTDDESIWTAELLYGTLLEPSTNGKTLVPWLATGYTVSKNHLVWTFTLRKGLRFSNGKPLTSADVKFSIDQVGADPSNGFAFIDRAIKSIATPTPYTVVVTTKYAWAPLLSDLALFANGIIPANYGGETEQQFFEHPISSGPFVVKKWVKGSYLDLVKNKYYWQKGKPYLDAVTIEDVPASNTRQLQLQSGSADVIEDPSYSSISQLDHQSGLTVDSFPSSYTEYMGMNENVKPFQELAVRRAISYAIDRQAIVKAVLFGHGSAATGYMSPAEWAYDPKAPGIQYNLAMAKKAMSESTVPHGFSATLLIGSGNTTEETMGAIIQSELKPLGINVTLKVTDPNSEQTDIEKGHYDMGFQYTTTDIIDPDEMTSYTSMGGNYGQLAHTLWTNFNNVPTDKLGVEAEKTFNHAERVKLYDEIQVENDKEAVLAYLYYSPYIYGVSTKVHGLYINPEGWYNLQNVWLGN